MAAFCLGFALFACFWCFQTGQAGRTLMSSIPLFEWVGIPSCGFSSDALFWLRGNFRNVLEMTKGMIFLILVCPRSRCFMTIYGQYSLYPYLLQGLAYPELKYLISFYQGLEDPSHALGFVF